MVGTPLERLATLTTTLRRDVPALAAALPDPEYLSAIPRTRCEVYLLGTIKSGKSTLVNALVGRDVMPRGAGVKTFNLTRARRADALSATVLFADAELLRARLEFDFRMVAFPAKVPENPYAPEGTAVLVEALSAFEEACRSNKRLADVDADAPLLGLLPRSLARIRRSIAGLVELQKREAPEVVQQIASEGALVFGADAFDAYLAWTGSVDLAALIRGIDLELPPAAAPLPRNLELIDCQGSDSLNALDFADVESVVQRADAILYVVQSRLGLRQGDRDLLRLVAQSGAGERVIPVLNVDAFDPLDPETLDDLRDRVRADLEKTLGMAVEPRVLAGLEALETARGDDAELELMATLWRRRDAEASWQRVRAGAPTLRAELTALAEAPRNLDESRCARAAAQQCRVIVRSALDRDATLLGTDASGMARAEALAAVQRILDGERQRIREDAVAEVQEALADDGSLARELDALMEEQGTRYLLRRPVPEALLAERHAPRVLDAALATFNADWLGAEGSERARNLAEVRGWLVERLAQAFERIERMLPDAARSGALLDGGTEQRAMRDDPVGAVERLVERVPVPRVLSPVLLPAPVRQALMAMFVSRGLMSRLRRAESDSTSDLLARRVETLWRRTLAAGFRQAQEERAHAFANARENFKFQYCFRIADLFVGMLTAELLADVERHYMRLARLAADDQLFLSQTARMHLERSLEELDKLAQDDPGEAPSGGR